METQMYTIPANTMLFIGLGIVLAIIGFVIYGFRKGFENTFKDVTRESHSHDV